MDNFPQKNVSSYGECAIFGTKNRVKHFARHPLAQMFLQHLQERHCHHGVEFSRALNQQNFSILKFSMTLRSFDLRGVTCRKCKIETFTLMKGDFTRESLAVRYPFTNTGIDYFGPFYVLVTCSTEKRRGFFLTCLTTRAVHFAVASSVDTSSWVMET